MEYKQHKYVTLEEARRKQKRMLRDYKYEPQIFKVMSPKTKSKYVVVEPKGLVKSKPSLARSTGKEARSYARRLTRMEVKC